jgi:hypothetical protein
MEDHSDEFYQELSVEISKGRVVLLGIEPSDETGGLVTTLGLSPEFGFEILCYCHDLSVGYLFLNELVPGILEVKFTLDELIARLKEVSGINTKLRGVGKSTVSEQLKEHTDIIASIMELDPRVPMAVMSIENSDSPFIH